VSAREFCGPVLKTGDGLPAGICLPRLDPRIRPRMSESVGLGRDCSSSRLRISANEGRLGAVDGRVTLGGVVGVGRVLGVVDTLGLPLPVDGVVGVVGLGRDRSNNRLRISANDGRLGAVDGRVTAGGVVGVGRVLGVVDTLGLPLPVGGVVGVGRDRSNSRLRISANEGRLDAVDGRENVGPLGRVPDRGPIVMLGLAWLGDEGDGLGTTRGGELGRDGTLGRVGCGAGRALGGAGREILGLGRTAGGLEIDGLGRETDGRDDEILGAGREGGGECLVGRGAERTEGVGRDDPRDLDSSRVGLDGPCRCASAGQTQPAKPPRMIAAISGIRKPRGRRPIDTVFLMAFSRIRTTRRRHSTGTRTDLDLSPDFSP